MKIISQKRKIGAGDAVEFFARPLARAADAIFHTKLLDCGGCGERKEKLNAMMPDVLHPFNRGQK